MAILLTIYDMGVYCPISANVPGDKFQVLVLSFLVNNTIGSTTRYKDLLDPLELPDNDYTNTTLPVQHP
jgi:hypothetical protein